LFNFSFLPSFCPSAFLFFCFSTSIYALYNRTLVNRLQ
jgi:hypothetical protein